MICQTTQKVAHSSREAAMIVQRKLKNCLLNPYRCPHCRKWHLGNSHNGLRKVDRIDQLLSQHAKKMKNKGL